MSVNCISVLHNTDGKTCILASQCPVMKTFWAYNLGITNHCSRRLEKMGAEGFPMGSPVYRYPHFYQSGSKNHVF